MRSSYPAFPSLIVDGRARRAIVRTAYFQLAAPKRAHRVWPVFVFAAVFGVVTAILTKPAHHETRRAVTTESRHSG